ncbi:hypothetical protein TNCV_2265911 [Trichonephila clavipes]|nr:hypothetical protein TNCV_2265911 [Trichonephila clavipes]
MAETSSEAMRWEEEREREMKETSSKPSIKKMKRGGGGNTEGELKPNFFRAVCLLFYLLIFGARLLTAMHVDSLSW